MKKLLIGLALILLSVTTSNAASVQFSWNPTEGTEITDVNIYMDNTKVTSAAFTTGKAELLNVTPGKHSFYAAGSNVWGEGPKTEIVTTPEKVMIAPQNFKLNVTYTVQTGTSTVQ